MKYLLLIYSNPESWEHPVFERTPGFLALTDDERAEVVRGSEAAFGELVASGEFVGGTALAEPGRSRTVRTRDGSPVITDGPFGEAKEQLAGYIVVDCAGEERAAEIAAGFPDARFGVVEIRPVVDMTPDMSPDTTPDVTGP
jgi:hypothetical protein